MQTIPLTAKQADDYQSSMQQAAAKYIERHQAEHLNDDGLFERTVRYLVRALEVPSFMADRLVHLAMSDRLPKGKPLASIDLGTCAVLDNRTGQWDRPPLRTLPQRYQAQFLDQLGMPATLTIR